MSRANGLGGLRLGLDVGGTKIEGAVFSSTNESLGRLRIAAPRNDYAATISAIAGLVADLESGLDSVSHGRCSIGVGVPGSISPLTGLMQNANSTWLNGRAFDKDLALSLGRPVRIANDANCFALSEATDGAGAGIGSVFGVILGTGCGGGIVLNGRLVDGGRGIGGEWGHNPLPWAGADEYPGPLCWCERRGCMETWVSGPALEAEYSRLSGRNLAAGAIAAQAIQGEAVAQQSLARHASRLARGLSHVVNIIDPDVIVLGGGLSKLPHLYEVLPALMEPHIFAASKQVHIVSPRWGDASGVRGAAWLWDA
ncbi:MAG: ROK family protein [Hyphomicrobium sp.]